MASRLACPGTEEAYLTWTEVEANHRSGGGHRWLRLSADGCVRGGEGSGSQLNRLRGVQSQALVAGLVLEDQSGEITERSSAVAGLD
jgi:hypothetical protein